MAPSLPQPTALPTLIVAKGPVAPAVGLEASYDGGTTWQHFCSVTAAGVPGTNPDGTPATATSIVVNLPPAGARMKAFAFTNGQSVRLAVSLVEIT